MQEISIVYALTALAIPVCTITVENIRQRLRRASPVIRCRPIVYGGTGARDDGRCYWFGLVVFGAPFWAARRTGILLKYASHVGDNSVR